MAIAAPPSSASLEPTKIPTRIARPRRSQPFKTDNGRLPTVKQRRFSTHSVPVSSDGAGRRCAGIARYSRGRKMLRTLFLLTMLAGALAGSALAQTPDAGCA